jgi:NTP pyrophosphatase (non-canonical NTP hydrolase)
MIAGSIGSEVGEAVDVVQRTGSYGEEFGDELADTIIRVADLAGYLGIDLGRAVHQKMRRNRERPRKHGKVC